MANSTTTPAAQGSHEAEKLEKLIEGIEVGMLTTAMPDGSMRSRPMETRRVEPDGTIWFFCSHDSAMAGEVEGDRHVNVSYADPSHNRYVSVSGAAKVVRDRALIKEMWTPALKAWFPKGPEDDPHVALLRVDVSSAEYWDAPSSAMVKLAGFVKAIATGQKYEPGENAKVRLQPQGST
jgi:general stress protein 26